MAFALVSTTRGDELIRPTETVVAVSMLRERLERLRDFRALERQDWLSTHSIPWFCEAGLIATEEIKEVMGLPDLWHWLSTETN